MQVNPLVVPKIKVEELHSAYLVQSGWHTLTLSDNLYNYDTIVFEMFSGGRETASIIAPYPMFNDVGRDVLLTDFSDGPVSGVLVQYATDSTITVGLVAGTDRYVRVVGVKWS